MLGFLCLFAQCNWVYLKDGLYQCTRCKTVSKGAIQLNEHGKPV